ncbi:NAD(P)-dependent alcohol dehydrogenase [uncultured Brevundimonas sp.]|uniref:NAD(P)-dependent alcohol dehydrogenase n=1 Tax=uncultured Brevundimonas sp. TaxID=213418 RepID=UPI00261C0580|nr:NAD(P)-dependent alcohol dehydrogenase [uncultured Brevundimonas sp.]
MRTVAAVTPALGEDFIHREVELDALRPDEVLVRIRAVGICHTDIAHRDGAAHFDLPAVLGHEGAGVIEAVGDAVSDLAVGDAVVLSYFACRTCTSCREHRPAYCRQSFAGNFAGARPDGSRTLRLDGKEIASAFFGQSSFAHHAIVAAKGAVRVGHDLPLSTLAPLGCGIQTGAGAVMNTLDLKAGQSLAVFGAGAVGLSAVMAAKAASAGQIIAIDLSDERLELARALGADATYRADQADLVRAIRKASGGGVDAAVECVGSSDVLQSAFDVLGAGGTAVMLGLPPREAKVAVDMGSLLGGRRLVGSIEGDADPQVFIPRLIDLHRRGLFPFERLLRFYPFEAINEAVADMEAGRTVKPVLLMPETTP